MARATRGTAVIAVDVFFAAFAVMFALDSITESAPPTTRGDEYTPEIAVAWPWGDPADCLVLLEINDEAGDTKSNLDGNPIRQRDGEMCVTKFSEPIQLDGNAENVHARFMLLRHRNDAVPGEIRIGTRVIRGITVSTKLDECGAPGGVPCP